MAASSRTGIPLAVLALLLSLTGSLPLEGQSAIARPGAAVVPMPMLINPTPADLNGDGRMDLVGGRRYESSTAGGELVSRMGNGDGTFGPEQLIVTPQIAAPMELADINADGKIDIVAIDMRPNGASPISRFIWILPGRGDGTFDPAITVGTVAPLRTHWTPPAFASVADFNGDARADLAVAADPSELRVYPGNGDFTFGAPATLTTGAWPMAVIPSDFNNDGRPDLAVAARDGKQVDLFVNQGALVFGATSLPLDRAAMDVAAADLNGDGNVDLLVAAATEDFDHYWTFHDGRALVMLGNGDGTFQPALSHETPRGTAAILAGDFNRDGILDVATGNATGSDVEECGPLWSNVSILPGDGSGALGSAANFQFSYDPADDRFDTRIHSLHAARIDGDAQADLITSGGLLLNRAASANRSPVANAGEDITTTRHGPIVLRAQASDPDNDFLSYRWTDSNGRLIENCLQPMVGTNGPGKYTFTLTVTDGRGGTATDQVTVTDATTNNAPRLTLYRPQFNNPVPAHAPYLIQWSTHDPDGGTVVDIDISVDRNGQSNFVPIPACTNLPGTATECVWDDPGPPSVDASLYFRITDSQGDQTNTVARFQIVSGPQGALPDGWSNGDVGAVALAGAAGYDGRAFTVRGSGADIWGTADEFHWAYTSMTGDFQVVTRAALVQNVDRWTKAGLMIRETPSAGSRHASIFATPGTDRPVSFQRRTTTGGQSVHTGGSIMPPPVMLMLRRTGDVITASYKDDNAEEWTLLGTETLPGLPATVNVGLAVSSHVDGSPATATFDWFSIGPAGGDGGMPTGWACGDAGAVAARGSCSYEVDDELVPDFVLEGSGADIWGTADEFSYARYKASGDFSLTARVLSVENIHRWTKAGIMIRDWDGEGTAPAGARHASFLATPTTEKGTAFQRRTTANGSSVHTTGPAITAPMWLKLIRTGDRISAYYRKEATDPWTFLAEEILPGLPHQVSAMLVVSSHVDGTLARASFDHVHIEEQKPMASADIGTTVAGSTAVAGPEITMEGNGADIWNTADAFRFHYTRWTGNGILTVRVRSLEQTHAWSKAGLMFRESLDPGSKQVMAIVSGSRGLAMQWRSASAGISESTAPVAGTAPVWLMLRRFNDRFTAFWSTDGEMYHFLGEVSMPMAAEVYVGLPVTSHAPGTLATAVFDDFVIR